MKKGYIAYRYGTGDSAVVADIEIVIDGNRIEVTSEFGGKYVSDIAHKYSLSDKNWKTERVAGGIVEKYEPLSVTMKRFMKQVDKTGFFLRALSLKEKPHFGQEIKLGGSCQLLMSALPSAAWESYDYAVNVDRPANRKGV